jgi:hypothetical protein
LTRLVPTLNYSGIANLRTLQVTTAPAKSSPACCVLNNRSLATASNSRDSSASRTQVLLSQPPVLNSLNSFNSTVAPSILSLPCRAQLHCQLSTLNHQLSRPGGPRYIAPGRTQQKTLFSNNPSIIVGVFTYPLPRNGRLLIRLLCSNSCTRYIMFGLRYSDVVL